MIDKLLTELDALHAAATEGEWIGLLIETTYEMDSDDAAFTAAAHNHYPALRDEIRRLQAELAEAERQRDLLQWADAAKGKQLVEFHEYLCAQVATAERRGAAKELRRLAKEWRATKVNRGASCIDLRDRAEELEVPNV